MIDVNVETISAHEQEEILIRCHEINKEIEDIVKLIKEFDHQDSIIGFIEDRKYAININDIFYIESTDNHCFIYCEKECFETKMKLYEVLEHLDKGKFFRCSKQMILNVNKISFVAPIFNGRFEAKLINGEKTIISRSYVPELKKLIGL